MALIIYPATDYDSFITVAESDTAIGNYTPYFSTWDNLSPSEKEVYLRIAFKVIVDGLTTIPDPVTNCLKNAQAFNALHDLINGVSSPLVIDAVVKKEAVGQVKVEYFEPIDQKKSTSYIHPLSVKCLADLDYAFSISGFGQTTLGRS